MKRWYARQDLNLRPLAPEANALSPELRAHAEGVGFEPTAEVLAPATA